MRWYGSLDFSWGFHLDGGRLLEWLDHFYIGDWIACRGQFGIAASTTLSDHAPALSYLV